MTFEDLGLAPRLTARLTELGLVDPTPIQQKAIPVAMEGRDVMGLAQTGTGKTMAFGLPLLHDLNRQGRNPAPRHATGLVLAPTRELAKQIADNLADLTKGTHMKVVLVVGGGSIKRQIDQMARGADLLIATPGRLIDLLDRKAVSLAATRFLVLDEADQMLDMGFIHALRRLVPLLPTERQTMLFSATMPKLMADLSKQFLTDPVRIEVSPPGKAADKVTQCVHFVTQSNKQALLIDLLSKHRGDRSLVFARTKHGAERLMKNLDKAGFDTASIHGNKSQGQRDRAIKQFKENKIAVLVATDVAARGIDIPGIEQVYNYDLPNVPENYVHRIGRTARNGLDGQAVAFCSDAEMSELRAVEKALGTSIPVASGSPWEAPRGAAKPRGGKPKPQQQRRRRPENRGRPGNRRAA
ncbi:DEAD/DEAH box helicase [Roseisalinus antarcticus]|uniref:ATP-dependent RNA helicase RhlE n=1 Tax=Roseisalinus antarcticus TaxID=254357 RepID=A0A1Y5TXY3_9RHOB|nr:DEAD/DEAH box helicase [Roseisalinus antarcticus]SLN71148.1 ATP-dependent RNA helicase RhlE [Roseisalinus antarcticus]